MREVTIQFTTVLTEFRNPRKMDYSSFNIELCNSINQLESLTENSLPTFDQLDTLATNLQTSLQNALAVSCPLSKPKSNKLSKSWWSKDPLKLSVEQLYLEQKDCLIIIHNHLNDGIYIEINVESIKKQLEAYKFASEYKVIQCC